jgi:hypothetical protein
MVNTIGRTTSITGARTINKHKYFDMLYEHTYLNIILQYSISRLDTSISEPPLNVVANTYITVIWQPVALEY